MRSDEEKKNGLGRPERLFENLIFVKIFKFFKYFSKLQKTFSITFRVFGCFLEQSWMIKKSVPSNSINLKIFVFHDFF